MSLTTEEVRHLALLSRIRMTADEVERMRDQMDDILQSFEVLDQAATDDVEPTGHSSDVRTVMRDDRARASAPLDDVLANAPRREGDHIRIRAVLE